MDVRKLLQIAAEREASDLHLIVPAVPTLRIDGVLTPIEGEPPVTPKDTQEGFESITTESQREKFRQELELDFAYSLPGVARFRVNIAQQRGSMNLSLRCVPQPLPLPSVAKSTEKIPYSCGYD